MDWADIDSRAVAVALCDHFGNDFAEAQGFLFAQQLQQRAEHGGALQQDFEKEEGVEDADEWEEGMIIPMLGQALVTVGTVMGTGEEGFQDGAAAHARFSTVFAMLCLPDSRVLVADFNNSRLRLLSADLQHVSTVAGDGEAGHRDGAAVQAQFFCPACLALLPDGCILVADFFSNRLRLLSADLQQVTTVAGDGEEGHRDGAAAQAQFQYPAGLALLPDGCVLVADRGNHRLRLLSAALQQVSTVAGDGERGHRDGVAAQAQFGDPSSLALLPDGCVLVADRGNHCLRLLSADLQQVSTVAGDGERGHRDGAAAQALFDSPNRLALLPDGRVLLSESFGTRIRVLTADLQDVSTLTIGGVNHAKSFELLLDGRLLVAHDNSISELEGLVILTGANPAAKPPKQKKKKKKRAIAGGAISSSSGGGGGGGSGGGGGTQLELEQLSDQIETEGGGAASPMPKRQKK